MNFHPESNLIFCYGTLKREFPNHSIIQQINASFIAVAKTKFTFPLVLAGEWNSPFLIHEKNYPNSYKVQGEIFEVDKKGIERLDEFEGVGKGRYQRLKIEIYCHAKTGNLSTKNAWCYFRFGNSENLLSDSSKFKSFYGKKELKKYTELHLRPSGWRNE